MFHLIEFNKKKTDTFLLIGPHTSSKKKKAEMTLLDTSVDKILMSSNFRLANLRYKTARADIILCDRVRKLNFPDWN